MKKLIRSLCSVGNRCGRAAWLIGVLPAFAAPAARATEQLVVFVSPEASAVAKNFQDEHLPAIRTIAEELGVSLRVVDVRNGAPPEIVLTPAIVYQNHRGRSIYQGRYTTTERIRTFIRTARVTPQTDRPLVRHDLPVWRSERVTTVAPIKVAPVGGTPPQGYQFSSFEADARKAIVNGFTRFKPAEKVALGRLDRHFYMDFNPWISPEGVLYLSVALFSEFHCKTPIYSRPGEDFSGPWDQRDQLFARAAKALEQAVFEQMASAATGDGFDPVPASVTVVSWESLGLSLPSPPPDAPPATFNGPPPARRWSVKQSEDSKLPPIMFHFPAPFDGYAGEVRKVDGSLEFDADLRIESARGAFEVDVRDVTMGEPDLDAALMGSFYLNAGEHPKSHFTIESVRPEERGAVLAYGEPVRVTMEGRFTLKGVTIPLEVVTVFEPGVHADGRAELNMQGRFSISLVPFDLEGPDGPPPASETLVFVFQLTLVPTP